jgi:O-acetyl-ADP-ribose deacetylase (regulator of RNase III)
VDGAIHRRGGPGILQACREIRRTRWPDGLPTGDAVVTPAGSLPARWVVHTVGPVWHGGAAGEPELLARAYRNSLQAAADAGAVTVAFPSISTGAYGYPLAQAAPLALASVAAWLGEHAGLLAEVRFVLFSAADLATYQAAAEAIASRS